MTEKDRLRDVSRLLLFTFVLFWALPLAIGTWLNWGEMLKLTIWDALALTGIVAAASYEMTISARRLRWADAS